MFYETHKLATLNPLPPGAVIDGDFELARMPGIAVYNGYEKIVLTMVPLFK